MLGDLTSSFTKCTFTGNDGSYSYGSNQKESADISDVPPEFVEDYLSSISETSRGAIRANQGECKIIDSLIEKNNASNGGGIASYSSKILVDGCVIKENSAYCDLLENEAEATGPWSNMGQGGVVYINSSDGIQNDFWNTSFYDNTARNGYGGIYSFYNGPNDGGILTYPEVNVNFCSFSNNKETIKYTKEGKEWSARPGNGYAIPHINYRGCLVSDELCVDFFEKYETPSVDNSYCYFTNKAHMEADKVTLTENEHGHLVAKSTGNISLKVPQEFAKSVSSGHYENEPRDYSLGSNYTPNLFKEEIKAEVDVGLLVGISIACVVLIAVGLIVVFHLKKKKAVVKTNEETEATHTENTDELISRIEKEAKLTQREKEVLSGLIKGKKRSDIAKELFLSESAIKKYTASIYAKTGVHNKLELIMKYKVK